MRRGWGSTPWFHVKVTVLEKLLVFGLVAVAPLVEHADARTLGPLPSKQTIVPPPSEALVQYQWGGGVLFSFFFLFLVKFSPLEKTKYRPKDMNLETRLQLKRG